MIYRCSGCNKTTFELSCSQCAGSDTSILTPLDPSFYPEFQYKSKGYLHDLFVKKKQKAKLDEFLNNVLKKYSELKHPFFTNFVFASSYQPGSSELKAKPGIKVNGEYSEIELFHQVLINHGFNELRDFPQLLDKLLLTTQLSAEYYGFSRALIRHIKPTFSDTLRSWIEEAGVSFRNNLSLFFYSLWKRDCKFPELEFDLKACDKPGKPLVPENVYNRLLAEAEAIYFEIQVSRYSSRLARFDPARFVTIHFVDAMDGFGFEAFLVELFQTIGYDVQETKRKTENSADLFVKKLDQAVLIQARHCSSTLGVSAIQKALAAKRFYACEEALIVTNAFFTEAAKQAAETASVTLVDRAGLQGYLNDYNQKLIEQFELEGTTSRFVNVRDLARV